MIPDAAVEAAAWVVIAGKKHDADPVLIARAALEAAAPHMLAAAWDEGYEQADYDAPHAIKSDNPYRSET